MTKPTGRLRNRLLVALVAVSFGVLVVSGTTTLLLARRNARLAALHDLETKAPEIAQSLDRLGRGLTAEVRGGDTRPRRIIAGALRISAGTLVRVAGNGEVVQGLAALGGSTSATTGTRPAAESILDLPSGIEPSDLDTTALLAGEQQSGRRGDIVFVAQPLGTENQPPGAQGRLVLVLAQKVDPRPVGRAGPYFLLAGSASLVMAIGISYLLARRLTRPLAAMQATAGRIAAGDLSARVTLGTRPDQELAALGDTLNAMVAQLEHARGLERAFLLSVSHDLRTPLTSIRGYAEAIADGTVEGTAARIRAADIIASESRRLDRLVADLLDLARLDSHEFSLNPRPIDASAVITAAVDAFRPAADEIGVSIGVDAHGPVPADADPERLGQIVANLVENALKYATSSISVVVSVRATDLEIHVEDDGPGIDPADAPRVFDRLYTSRTTPGRKVGTGLGLAIVRELAAAMGGAARVEPLPGGGTRFVVHLPVVRPVASSPVPPPPV